MVVTEQKTAPGPDRFLRNPGLRLPDGACDCHFHIFGPQQFYPLHPDAPYRIEDSTLDDWVALQRALGLSKGLLVQSFLHRYTYDNLLNALFRYPNRLRAVALPAPTITEDELEILTEAGVVGARFGYQINPKLDLRMIHRVHSYGWQPHFFFRGEQLFEWLEDMRSLPGDFIIEHMGLQPTFHGLEAPGWRAILDLLDTGRCWIKLSHLPSSTKQVPYDDVTPFVHDLVKRAPERILWGTDWPHPATWGSMPNDAELVDLLLQWIPDAGTRHRILVDNPATLFRFDQRL